MARSRCRVCEGCRWHRTGRRLRVHERRWLQRLWGRELVARVGLGFRNGQGLGEFSGLCQALEIVFLRKVGASDSFGTKSQY